jgi:hypothetical protein
MQYIPRRKPLIRLTILVTAFVFEPIIEETKIKNNGASKLFQGTGITPMKKNGSNIFFSDIN